MNDNTITCVCNKEMGPAYYQESPIPTRPGFYAYCCDNPECLIYECSLGAEKIERLRNDPDELATYRRNAE